MFIANMSEVIIERYKVRHYLFVPYFWLLTSSVSVVFSQYCGFDANEIAGSKFNQSVYGILMTLGGVIIFRRWVEIRRMIASNYPLLLLLCYTFLSISWSDNKLVSFRRFVLFLGGLEMIFIIASGEDKYKDIFDVLYYFFITVSVLSIILIILIPGIGIMKELGGAWKGIMPHKNGLGQLAAVECFFWVFLMTSHIVNKQKLICTMFLILNIVLLFKSKSITGLFTFLFTLVFYFLLLLFKTQKQRIPLILICLGIILFCMLQIIEQLFLSVPIYKTILLSAGKNLTFTERTYIWELIFRSISKHPVLGCGFGGFWLGMEGASKYVYGNLHFLPIQSHNGYFDVLNELGIMGSIIFIVFLASTFFRNIHLAKYDYSLSAFWIPIITLILFSNTMETSFMIVNKLYWFLLTAAQIIPFPQKHSIGKV